MFGRLGNRLFQMAKLYTIAKDTNTDFYFYDPENFKKYENEIRTWYSASIPENTGKVAIHVRRGDFIDNPHHFDLTKTDYYKKAVEEFKGCEFLVFSDDIEWCKGYFIGDEYEFCGITDPVEAMNQMSACEGHIIANSSFSWWGAYLSPYGHKVVAPKNQFNDGVERLKYPLNWIII